MEGRKTRSLVHVTFRDTGEVKTYLCSASPGISRYFAASIARDGCLCIMDGGATHTIMADLIREYRIEEYRPATEEGVENGE